MVGRTFWTLGSLLCCGALVQAFRLHFFSPERPLALHATVTTMILLGAAFIRLNCRLFAHLDSEDGRFEFATPDSERNAVAKSAAVYIAWCTLSVLVML